MPKTASNFSISGFIKLTRIGNLFIIAFAQYFTALYLVGNEVDFNSTFTDIHLLLVSVSSVLIAAAGYIINDYYDVKIDYINKPERVVVGKVIKRRVVMASHTIINFIGIAIGFLVAPIIALVNFISALLLWFYSNHLKRLPLIGNLVVSVLTGLSIYIVAILYNYQNHLIITYSLFAFGYTLIREIVKDIEDVKGDEAFECKTIPVVYGIRKTKIFLGGYIALLGIVLSMVLLNTPINRGTLLVIGNLIMLSISGIALYNADTKKQFHQLSSILKVMMLIGVLSMMII